MRIAVHLMLAKLDGCYDDEDESNEFDLGVQYLMDDMITFPRVESEPGSRVDATGCMSYPICKGLVPEDFEGGSLTWLGIRLASSRSEERRVGKECV